MSEGRLLGIIQDSTGRFGVSCVKDEDYWIECKKIHPSWTILVIDEKYFREIKLEEADGSTPTRRSDSESEEGKAN